MPKVLTNISRMFVSARNIMGSLFCSVTKKTSTVFQVSAETIGTIFAIILVTVMLAVVVIVSIPLSAFGHMTHKEKPAEVINIKPIQEANA